MLLDLKDKYRVLLTEVLPYEVPLRFDNSAFYKSMRDHDKRRKVLMDLFGKVKDCWSIAFDYTVRRSSGNQVRTLSIMHPLNQLQVADFYESYDEILIYCCNQSPFSLRHISDVAKCTFYDIPDKKKTNLSEAFHVEMDKLGEEQYEDLYRSYFKYRSFYYIYKFFQSSTFARLEQKFSHMMRLDIANCFYHIYTHSLTWAVKGKSVAKGQTKDDNFENNFDRLMQRCNYNETNGILVGPELSRIFAEIILQRIDLNVMEKLREKQLVYGRDYEVYRYVDDHCVYAHSIETLDKIKQVYHSALREYRLFINESKCEILERPFGSGLDNAKGELEALVNNLYGLRDAENGGKVRNVKVEWFAAQLRRIASKNEIKYGQVNAYLLSLLTRKMERVVRGGNEGLTPLFFISAAEVALYSYSLGISPSTSIKLCRLLNLLWDGAEKMTDKEEIKQELKITVYRNVLKIIESNIASDDNNVTDIEMMNLLLVMDHLGCDQLSEHKLMELFGLKASSKGASPASDHLNYFHICTLLYLIRNNPQYAQLKQVLEDAIKGRFKDEHSGRKAEDALLLLDMMTCPFITKQIKMDILITFGVCKHWNTAAEKVKEYMEPKRWFFDWDRGNSLTNFIVKKSYRPPYE